MIGRVISTVIALVVYGWAMMAYTPQATLVTGQVAGRQFENSDQAFLTAIYTMNIFTVFGGLMTLLLLGVLVLIWLKPVRDAIRKAATLAIVLAAGTLLALNTGDRALAFFDKTDKTEVYTILPNESAFWIPDIGANQDT